jgi:hypothetical protein
MVNTFTGSLREKAQRSTNALIALALALSGMMPILLTSQASAAQLSNRSVTISTSQAGALATDYTFRFTPSAATAIQSIVFQFCDAPLGACVKPANMNVGYATTGISGTQSGFSQVTAFAEYSGANSNGCSAQGVAGNNTATTYCVTRTQAASDDTAAKTLTVTGITNPTITTGNNTSLYVRVTTYTDAAFLTEADAGTVAAAIIDQLTTTGRVQERLNFCVFALDDADASASAGSGNADLPTDCAALSANESTSVDLGVIDNSGIAVSPVDNTPPTAMGNDRIGGAIINTNASNGVVLSYYASLAGSGTDELRAFRVNGVTCNNNGTTLTDQCFISAANGGEDFTAGTERFGLQIACIANAATSGVGTTSNLGRNSGGVVTSGDGTAGSFNDDYEMDLASSGISDDGTDTCENAATTNSDYNHFAWNDTGTAVALASSTTVVDDELVKLRYGATAAATTPTGTYSVASTYIATPTF